MGGGGRGGEGGGGGGHVYYYTDTPGLETFETNFQEKTPNIPNNDASNSYS